MNNQDWYSMLEVSGELDELLDGVTPMYNGIDNSEIRKFYNSVLLGLVKKDFNLSDMYNALKRIEFDTMDLGEILLKFIYASGDEMESTDVAHAIGVLRSVYGCNYGIHELIVDDYSWKIDNNEVMQSRRNRFRMFDAGNIMRKLVYSPYVKSTDVDILKLIQTDSPDNIKERILSCNYNDCSEREIIHRRAMRTSLSFVGIKDYVFADIPRLPLNDEKSKWLVNYYDYVILFKDGSTKKCMFESDDVNDQLSQLEVELHRELDSIALVSPYRYITLLIGGEYHDK